MNAFSTEEALVVLNVPPSLEELMIDWLLSLEHDVGFTSTIVNGHSGHHEGLSPAEQVSGRRRRLQFQIRMRSSKVDAFLAEAGTNVTTSDVYYWVVPVIKSGQLKEL